jgi:hypothetical protein
MSAHITRTFEVFGEIRDRDAHRRFCRWQANWHIARNVHSRGRFISTLIDNRSWIRFASHLCLTDNVAILRLLASARLRMSYQHERSFPPGHRRADVECVVEYTAILSWKHLGACDAMFDIAVLVQTGREKHSMMWIRYAIDDVQARVGVYTSHPFCRQIDAMCEIMMKDGDVCHCARYAPCKTHFVNLDHK